MTPPSQSLEAPALTSAPLEELLRTTPRLDGIDGLREAALQWHRDANARRPALQRQAQALATPRLWHDTIAGLATSTWRMATTVAPDAGVALLTAAAGSSGMVIGPPRGGRSTIDRAQRLVRAGGPAYIKLGQFVATGDGLLPKEWVDAFAWCRDEAPALRPGRAESIVQRELGSTAGRLATMDPTPLATGSIGQVHRGTLSDGTRVVIKVRRPRLVRRLRSDIETLALVAAAAPRVRPELAAAGLSGFVELFAELILEELDFRIEAANLVEASAVLDAIGADEVRAPRPIPGMVTERVLVMEELPGISYAKLPPETAADLDGTKLLRVGVKAVLEATLVHGAFHGDLHAGNVLIADDGTFSLVDLGIAGRLDATQRAALVTYLMGFAASDATLQVQAMEQFGALSKSVDREALVEALQAELARIDAREAGAITFERLGEVLGSLLRLLAERGVTLPKDLVLFFKNLLYLSGFSATVAPNADLFAVIQDLLQEVFSRSDLAASS